jgi:hypothetical protein
MTNQVDNLSGSEVLNLASQKKEMFCPICSVRLVTIPLEVAEGSRPLGVTCPNDKEHFFVYGEDASRVQEMRDRMKAFKKQQYEKKQE